MYGKSLTSARLLRAFLTGAILMLVVSPILAQAPRPVFVRTSDSVRVTERLPLEKLTAVGRAKIESVTEHASIVCRLPTRQFRCNKDIYLHLVRHPEIAVDIWRQMGVTQLQLRRESEFEFRTRDSSGAASRLELIYGTPELHIFYADGAYTGPILKHQLKGSCVMVLETEYSTNAGQPQVAHRMEVHARLDDVAGDLLARTLKPLVDRVMEHNFRESSRFAAQVYEAAEQNRDVLERYVRRMTRVQPTIKEQFSQLIDAVPGRPMIARDNESLPLRR